VKKTCFPQTSLTFRRSLSVQFDDAGTYNFYLEEKPTFTFQLRVVDYDSDNEPQAIQSPPYEQEVVEENNPWAYHLWKAGHCDRMIDVLGADHKLISGQLKAVLNALGENEPEIVIFEFVSLPEGSMSTRRGKFISTDELLDQINTQAMVEVEKRRPDTSDDFKQEVANFVGIGAIRYDVVKVSPEKSTVFDWREALDFEKQGAPFIQYSHARACSILANAKGSGVNLADLEHDISVLVEDQEIELIKHLARLTAVIDTAAVDLKPHHLATYAREVADSFNQFYRYVPVLNAEVSLRDSRLVLVDCARNVLSIVLDTLGLHAPKSM